MLRGFPQRQCTRSRDYSDFGGFRCRISELAFCLGALPKKQKASSGTDFIPIGDCFKLKDYPNLTRTPVARGMALVGDAAVSMDPLYGVGCGWAFQTAEWLVDSTIDALQRHRDIDVALRHYARLYAKKLDGHQFVIKDFSKRNRFNFIERVMFRASTMDKAAAEHFFRFGARISSLQEFLAPRAILRALWVNLFEGEGNSGLSTRTSPPTLRSGV
jgi:hypothetical protein